MTEHINLCELAVGEYAIVDYIDDLCPLKRRLLDLGLINGTKITCLMKSPLGDPTAYLIRGNTIALRGEEQKMIYISAWGKNNGADS